MNKLETVGPGKYEVYVPAISLTKPEYVINLPNTENYKTADYEHKTTTHILITLPGGRDGVLNITGLTKYSKHNVKAVMSFEEFTERDPYCRELPVDNISDIKVTSS